LHPLGWPKAFWDVGVSGTMVLEPSTKYVRSPHHNAPGEPQASCIAVADSCSNV